MNIANLITIFRIILVPIYLRVFFSNISNGIFWAGLIFIVAGISDILDGYIARKYNLITKVGSVLDPIADKLMSFAVLISLTWSELIPIWILIAIGMKELTLIIGGSILYLFKGNQVLPSNRYGKIATVSFYIAALSVVFKFPEILSKTLFVLTVSLNLLAFINYLIIYLSMGHNTEKIS